MGAGRQRWCKRAKPVRRSSPIVVYIEKKSTGRGGGGGGGFRATGNPPGYAPDHVVYQILVVNFAATKVTTGFKTLGHLYIAASSLQHAFGMLQHRTLGFLNLAEPALRCLSLPFLNIHRRRHTRRGHDHWPCPCGIIINGLACGSPIYPLST